MGRPLLGAIGRVHLGEILGPIAMVAVRHLVHHRRQDDAVHTEFLNVVHQGTQRGAQNGWLIMVP